MCNKIKFRNEKVRNWFCRISIRAEVLGTQRSISHFGSERVADRIDKGHISQFSKSKEITGEDWRDKILDKKGVICFEDYYPSSRGSGGDHIDLWYGNSLTGLGSWFRTRFSIVVPGYWSDFRKSKRIRFFEVKV